MGSNPTAATNKQSFRCDVPGYLLCAFRGTPSNEQPPVEFGLPFQRKGIGAGCGGHAPEADRLCRLKAGCTSYLHLFSHRRRGTGIAFGNDAGGLFSGSDEISAVWDAPEQSRDVGWRDHFQEGIGGVVFQAPDFAGGVVEGESLGGAKLPDQRFVKPLFGRNAEVILVPKLDEAQDTPEVIDPVGVIEWHAPAVRLGRETAQKEHPCSSGQERLKGMTLDAHPTE